MPTGRERKRPDSAGGVFRPMASALGAPRPEPERQEPAPAPAVVRAKTTQASAEDTVLWIVNDVRTKAGLRRVRFDERLRAAARSHSEDMARRGFCAHVNPDGVTPAQRMSAAGCPNPGGENVAYGQAQPHAVMTAWMNSPGHRANILNPDFATLGVGVALGKGGPYWTQNFGY